MARSFKAKPAVRLGEIAKLIGATLKGDADILIDGIGPLEDAGPGQLSFVSNSRYASLAASCRASALIVPPALAEVPLPCLVCDNPYSALAKVAQLFARPATLPQGVHPSALVGDDVTLGPNVAIGPLVQIGEGSSVGGGSMLFGGVYLGNNVTVGANCTIHPNVSILDGCVIGDRVVIHSGTVIGSDGFGYAQDESGRHLKIPQAGIVQIDDDVEIGANCTIDRATFGRTWIQRGCKIDNLVQIGHNVVIGEHSILISQVGISGSTTLGKHVILAGQVGLGGHINIGDGVRIGAKSGVSNSVKAGQDVSGIPAVPHKEWLKNSAGIRRLSKQREELRQLRMRVERLEQQLSTASSASESQELH